MSIITLNKRYFRDLIRRYRLAFYNKKYGEKYKFANLEISLPSDCSFNIKYALIRKKYESNERRLILKYIEPSLPVIELGGSLGIVSKLISSILDNKAKHIIVEANPNIIDACKINALIERRKHSTFIVNRAIAYGREKVNFYISDNEVCSKIVNDGSHNSEIETTNLSKLVKKYIDNTEYVLVMDIEGGEVDVFINDNEVLKKCSFAIVEIHPEIFLKRKLSINNFFDLVKKTGLNLIDSDGDVYVFSRNSKSIS